MRPNFHIEQSVTRLIRSSSAAPHIPSLHLFSSSCALRVGTSRNNLRNIRTYKLQALNHCFFLRPRAGHGNL
ncbi:hypothetical protein BDZ91DRAFT_737612 [Kalaharituber pfeilii]|nr:hypothetical protein BDZ91DRAFT_737612 [Kalaharituber pfeilii]